MTVWHHYWRPTLRTTIPLSSRRCLLVSAWERDLAKPVQTYISNSRDPYLNLSIEHDVLQKSAKDSVVLFLYVNRPSVIIGRNQNPWLEVNLPLLETAQSPHASGLGAVDLVRRRSGGGTVFHDEGNVNWTVICPRESFTRDKHAEMVVRALRSCGVDRARVNERHDIVLDQGERLRKPDPDDTHTTAYTNIDEDGPRPLKVSGSAYKITGKQRALHHGTCLLSTPNLKIIPEYLHSPMKPYIKEARGVQSVSSPVGNIHLSNEEFCSAVYTEFMKMYPENGETHLEEVDEDMLDVQSVAEGCEELKSLKNMYESTPQFILCNTPDEDPRLHLELTIKVGEVLRGSLSSRDSAREVISHFDFSQDVDRPKLHQIDSGYLDDRGETQTWESVLRRALPNLTPEDLRYLTQWLRGIMPPKDESIHG